MKLFGLIGLPLSHSFSKKYFADKFQKEGISDCAYELFELADIDQLTSLLDNKPELCGLNVTIPYKEAVLPYLNKLDHSATKVGAVNVIKVEGDTLTGYNSDYFGFKASLDSLRGTKDIKKALVLGSGGASKAVIAALKDLGANISVISRTAKQGSITYDKLKLTDKIATADLIVNTTPLGMYPETNKAPDIAYDKISPGALAFDLIYNPELTEFLRLAENQGAGIKNGLEMLELQAEKSWEIWNA